MGWWNSQFASKIYLTSFTQDCYVVFWGCWCKISTYSHTQQWSQQSAYLQVNSVRTAMDALQLKMLSFEFQADLIEKHWTIINLLCLSFTFTPSERINRMSSIELSARHLIRALKHALCPNPLLNIWSVPAEVKYRKTSIGTCYTISCTSSSANM